MTHQSLPVDATEVLPPVEALAAGVAREAEALDASLDRAFATLRDIRAGLSRIGMMPADGDLPMADWDPVPAQVTRYLEEEMRGIAGRLHSALNAAGAPPEKDAAARRTADQLELAADVLTDECAELDGTRSIDASALLEKCREDATTLARRLSAPIGKLMGIMQLRDNIDQRTTHVIAGCTLSGQYPPRSAALIQAFLSAQVVDMADSVRDGSGVLGTAAGTVLDLGRQTRTDIIMATTCCLLPRSGVAISTARALRSEWAGFGGLSEVAGDLSAFMTGSLTEAVTPLAHGLVALAGGGEAARLTHVLDCLSKIMAAARAMDVEAGAMGTSAFAIDGLAERLVRIEDLTDQPLDDADRGLEALWASYSTDAEREVHANLVRRFG